MNKNNIINNWDILYKNYSKLNPDLILNGITTKRALLNHYMKYGINENRKIFDNDNDHNNFMINNIKNIDNIVNKDNINNIDNIINKDNTDNKEIIDKYQFILNELIIIEKLDN